MSQVTDVAGLFTLDSLCGIGTVDYTPQSQLFQNTPNPVSKATDIRFYVAANERVAITVYNVYGAVVTTVADGIYQQGMYAIPLTCTQLPTGQYYYRMTAGKFTALRALTVLH